MPIVKRNVVDGFDTEIISVVESSNGMRLKDYKKVILNQELPGVNIGYFMKPLNPYNDMFKYNIHLGFVDNPNDNVTDSIIFDSNNDNGMLNIIIGLLNWGKNGIPTKMSDNVTTFKEIIDCNNGITLMVQLAIQGSVMSNSYVVEIFTWAKISDPDKVLYEVPTDEELQEQQKDKEMKDPDTTVVGKGDNMEPVQKTIAINKRRNSSKNK